MDEEYLFLVAAAGHEEIRLVHERLYRQLGEPLPASFVPHVTIARTSDRARLVKASSRARNHGLRLAGIASHLCVYRIDGPDRRIREAVVSLASRTT